MGSPWGVTDEVEELCPGVYSVSTPSHGGTMVERLAAFTFLSPAARKCGEWYGDYLCFEEDCAEAVILWELYHSKRFSPPLAESDPKKFEQILLESLNQYYPEYLQAWQRQQKSKEQPQKRHSVKER